PGRFDRQVTVNHPDLRGRSEILKVHTKNVPVASNVDLEKIARGTPGFSGADLANLVNEAALWAARQNKSEVGTIDFEMAKDKIMMGAERKSMVLTDQEKQVTAYHEAGHALMAKLLPGTDPVHKVSIIPRGRALGVTMQLPTDDRHNHSQGFLYNTLAILLGGRVAEELVFQQVTAGAGNDLERATALARKMVCEWGMSDKLGPLTFGQKEESMFLGHSFGGRREVSDTMALEIDLEIKRLVTENYERAKRILTEQMGSLQALAEALLEKETLDGLEIDQIISNASSIAVPV
ncbi:MAG TPA: cell division protein FtsH, partial [Nitrospira sp.]|nr:cell division protein FtsH [Nitrospira sp.]